MAKPITPGRIQALLALRGPQQGPGGQGAQPDASGGDSDDSGGPLDDIIEQLQDMVGSAGPDEKSALQTAIQALSSIAGPGEAEEGSPEEEASESPGEESQEQAGGQG